jgi:hypothetical protein
VRTLLNPWKKEKRKEKKMKDENCESYDPLLTDHRIAAEYFDFQRGLDQSVPFAQLCISAEYHGCHEMEGGGFDDVQTPFRQLLNKVAYEMKDAMEKKRRYFSRLFLFIAEQATTLQSEIAVLLRRNPTLRNFVYIELPDAIVPFDKFDATAVCADERYFLRIIYSLREDGTAYDPATFKVGRGNGVHFQDGKLVHAVLTRAATPSDFVECRPRWDQNVPDGNGLEHLNAELRRIRQSRHGTFAQTQEEEDSPSSACDNGFEYLNANMQRILQDYHEAKVVRVQEASLCRKFNDAFEETVEMAVE